MTLRARLLLFGAALPAALLVVSVFVSGALFEREQLAIIDDAMRTQAAVQAAQLADGAGGPLPDLDAAALVPGVDASMVAIYGADGARLSMWPDDAPAPETLVAVDGGGAPRAITVERGGARVRTLALALDVRGQRLSMWLGHSLGDHEATLATYYRVSLAVLVLVTLVLLALSAGFASSLARRVGALVRHMERLRHGQLDLDPDVDATRDAIGELRDAIAVATERLREARAAEERLVADAAHELRTPLATMRATIDVTLRRPRSTEELREALENAREEVERLTRLASELLDLSSLRARRPERAPVDLAEITSRAVEHVRVLGESRGVALELRAPRELPLEGSPRELRQAVDNLLANALAFAPDGTRITVDVEREGERARVVVRDRGPGIPEPERLAVFEPFHRVDRRRPGAGLGLAIVQGIAERHGGRALVLDEREGTAIALEIAA